MALDTIAELKAKVDRLDSMIEVLVGMRNSTAATLDSRVKETCGIIMRVAQVQNSPILQPDASCRKIVRKSQ